jgi:RNA polymerase sigma-B factor
VERKGLAAVEADLLERIKKGDDPEAKERFFARYEDMLCRFAHKYKSQRLPYEDAYQLAALGLMKALRRFDPERGISFITFAYPTVDGELKKHYRDHVDIIRLPRPLRDLRQRIIRETKKLWDEEGADPNIKKLASRLRVSEEEIIETLAAQQSSSVFSLDSSSSQEHDCPPLNLFVGSPDPAFEEVERNVAIDRVLSGLPLRHRRAIELRLHNGWTQARIAEEMGVSQMHVSRLIRDSVEILRDKCSTKEETA